MPLGLKRYHQSGQSHFVTFSCYQRTQLLDERLRDLFLACLEQTRRRYQFRVYGYVVMPEHIHLLLSEPGVEVLSKAIQALKISVSRRAAIVGGSGVSRLWQKRYYDHNIRDYESFVEKLRYIHRNPVKRGLCTRPEDWRWSSFRHYATAEIGVVEIESEWTARRRMSKAPHLLRRCGAPST
ncbi:MAG: transposase [Terriglobales bacterium]